jgi:hypothetical protein
MDHRRIYGHHAATKPCNNSQKIRDLAYVLYRIERGACFGIERPFVVLRGGVRLRRGQKELNRPDISAPVVAPRAENAIITKAICCFADRSLSVRRKSVFYDTFLSGLGKVRANWSRLFSSTLRLRGTTLSSMTYAENPSSRRRTSCSRETAHAKFVKKAGSNSLS